MALTDTMVFETVRDSLEALLVAHQTGYFITIVGQKQSFSADQFKGTSRTIQIFYSSGDYNEGPSSGQKLAHDCSFTLNYYVSAPCKADKITLNDDTKSAAQKQAAIANVTMAYREADREMDAFRRMITQILADPVNKNLGLERNTISNRRLRNFTKTQVINHGNLVELNASETLSFRADETLTGVTGTAAVSPTLDIINNPQPIDGTTVTPPSEGVQTEQ